MRRTRLLAALITGALVLAACGVSRDAAGSSGIAATVEFADGSSQQLLHSDLDDIVMTTSGNQEFLDLVYQGTVPPGFEAVVLSQTVIGEVLANQLDQAGGATTDENVDEARTLLFDQLEGLLAPTSSDPAADVQRLYDEVPYLPFIVNLQATQIALSAQLAESAPEGSGDPCVRHILLEDEAAAVAVLAELDGGADFAELAMERSTGPSGPDGGDLGCAPAANYVPEFANAVLAAEIGAYVGPVETQFGHHVILVEGFEVNGDLLAQASLEDGLAGVLVTVDEEIGVWDGTQAAIIPTSGG